MVHRLSRREFRDALNKGLGRAILHAREFGIRGLESEIVSVLKSGMAYDQQCEWGRGGWLWRALDREESRKAIRGPLLRLLRGGISRYATREICELAGCYAAAGDDEVKSALYRVFERELPEEGLVASEEIIKVDRLEGFRRLARVVGRDLRRGRKIPDYAAECVFYDGEEVVGRSIVLKAMRESDADMRVFWKAARAAIRRKTDKKPFPVKKWSDVVREIDKDPNRGYGLARRFGKSANSVGLEQALRFIVECDDPAKASAALGIFANSPLPRFEPKLKEMARRGDRRTQWRAFEALSTLRDSRIRRFAEDSLGDARLIERGCWFLLEKNYRDQDGPRVLRVLRALRNEETVHSAVMALRDVVRKRIPPSLLPAAIEACYKSRCGLCRADIFESISGATALPRGMLEEFELDANDDARAAAKRALVRAGRRRGAGSAAPARRG